jgi:hypothetical protein
MRLVPPLEECDRSIIGSEAGETIILSSETLEELSTLGRALSGDMPGETGIPFVVRALIERIESANPDLSIASDEDGIRAIVRDLLTAGERT